MTSWAHIWLSLVGPELEGGGGEELGSWPSLTSPNHVGNCGRKGGLSSLACCCRGYESEFYCFYGLAIVHLYS